MFLSEYPLFIPNSARYYIPIENTLLRNWFKSWEALSFIFLPTDLQKHQQPTETLAQGPVYTVTGSSVLFRRKKFVFPYVKLSRPVVLKLLGIFFYNPQLPITASQDLSFCKCIIFSYCGICGTVNTIMAFQPQVLIAVAKFQHYFVSTFPQKNVEIRICNTIVYWYCSWLWVQLCYHDHRRSFTCWSLVLCQDRFESWYSKRKLLTLLKMITHWVNQSWDGVLQQH